MTPRAIPRNAAPAKRPPPPPRGAAMPRASFVVGVLLLILPLVWNGVIEISYAVSGSHSPFCGQFMPTLYPVVVVTYLGPAGALLGIASGIVARARGGRAGIAIIGAALSLLSVVVAYGVGVAFETTDPCAHALI